jgi:ADP-heptose:LPS heptosyltransferase
VIVWSGEEEAVWAEQIVDHSGGDALMAPRTSLPELAALLRSARVYIGSETGPMHLASAVGTACIGLYGPTRVGTRGAYGRSHRAVQVRYQCGSYRQRRRAGDDAMRAIEPQMVCEECDRLLSASRPSGQTDAA